jgi:hypothetical protein
VVMVSFVTDGIAVAAAQVHLRQHALSLEEFERSVHGGTADPARAEVIHQGLGSECAGPVGNGADDDSALVGESMAHVGEAPQDPIATREVRGTGGFGDGHGLNKIPFLRRYGNPSDVQVPNPAQHGLCRQFIWVLRQVPRVYCRPVSKVVNFVA